jgi:type IV pilus assembly protein PilA
MNPMGFRTNQNREGGFSLIEILVVIVVLGILMAIAVPTFFGAKRSGYDSKAQSVLRSALAAERTYYVDYQEYTTSTTELDKIEPNIDWSTSNADAQGVKTVTAGGTPPQAVVLVSWSKSKTLFCIMNIAVTGTSLNGQSTAGTYYKRLNNVASAPGSPTSGACGTSGYLTTDTGW